MIPYNVKIPAQIDEDVWVELDYMTFVYKSGPIWAYLWADIVSYGTPKLYAGAVEMDRSNIYSKSKMFRNEDLAEIKYQLSKEVSYMNKIKYPSREPKVTNDAERKRK